MATKNAHSNECARLEVVFAADTAVLATGETIAAVAEIALPGWSKGVGFVIQSAGLIDRASQNAIVDLVLFNENPSATTFTPNGALTVADADMDKIIGVIQFAAADYVAFVDNSRAQKSNIGLLGVLPFDGDKIWAVPVSRGTPDYVAAPDLRFFLDIVRV